MMISSSGTTSNISKRKFRQFVWMIALILAVVHLLIIRLQLKGNQLKTQAEHFRHEISPSSPSKKKPFLGSPKLPADSEERKGAKWAYAFLVAGCDPDKPLTYRNYFYNILVAANLLDQNTSSTNNRKTDIIVMIQFTRASNATELPLSELQWLQTTIPNNPNRKLRIHYLPPPIRDNFYNAQLEKFRILEFEEYSRILYLDSDVMPLCSLDYLLELSESGVLKPNVVLAGFTEPASGGFFLLEPGQSYYKELLEIIETREGTVEWNKTLGWGAVMDQEWRGIPMKGGQTPRHSKVWTFHGDFADQGLLYYWTRYFRGDVSIIFLREIENWQDGSIETIVKSKKVFGNKTCLPPGQEANNCYGSSIHYPLFNEKAPHRDFIHFTGDKKPWEKAIQQFPKDLAQVRSSTEYWYYNLRTIFDAFASEHPNRKLPALPLKWKQPSLGRYPTLRSMVGTINKKKKHKALRKTEP
ncbi:unnamed protein product [Cylindrotheca closterium]|uniref:Hexosyltransferase n=1 Tax=Cylindrotheca closterium TaxID=2856 RepID=A0AAD2FRX2_9STRA|nr:unnamed protein product [Cylindrotheca closterium]